MTEAIAPKPTLITRAIETVKSDGADAAWRVAGNQFVRAARDPLVAALSERLAPGDETMRTRVAAFLATEAGEAAIAFILSFGLQLAPKAFGPVPDRLSRELRVRGMAGGMDLVAEIITKPLRELMTSGLLDDAIAQAKENVRIPEDLLSATRAADAEEVPVSEQVAVRDQKATR